ncbi:MAG: glycogen synthase GlgA [Candidatus Schekmanbacteria bacterium]|nr:glycogen synthase GlgA [Candidatus Schekmanbacteria bacterium]
MKVALLSSEVVPFAKTGGLADVSGALPGAIKRAGVKEVIVILPAYRHAKKSGQQLTHFGELKFRFAGKDVTAGILRSTIEENIHVYLIDKDEYYDREGLYVSPTGDYPDNAWRFAFFCTASIELLKKIDFKADIIHCNDWQSGLTPLLLKTTYAEDKYFSKTATCITVHNLAYQGNFKREELPPLGIPEECFSDNGMKFYDVQSFLKAGLIYSTVINTVSKKYSEEIQTEEFGCGMQNILKWRTDRLFGILNGVDYNEWSPETDKFIPYKFSISDLTGKQKCKEELQKESGLEKAPDKPLLGVVTRLAVQKGVDVLANIASKILDGGAQIVVLGTGEKEYETRLQEIAAKYPDSASVRIGFDNRLAHLIEAGSDMFLMPSRYEPCGLNQMYSLKYGTIPVVRATGGLDDTIVDFETDKKKGNGFKFAELNEANLLQKIKAACTLYKSSAWQKITKNSMACDFSWDKSAKEYIKLYKKAKTLI